MTGQRIGYIRVSTLDQNPDRQTRKHPRGPHLHRPRVGQGCRASATRYAPPICAGRGPLTNTIVVNSPIGSDVAKASGTLAGSNNLIDDAAFGTGFTDGANGNIIGHPAALATLADNGGPTQTFALRPGSLAIGHGNSSVCNLPGTGNVGGVDQRGAHRPAATCAIGAYEPAFLTGISPSSGATAGGNRVTLAGGGFFAGAAVSIGGQACGNVAVPNAATLTCTAAGHAAGTVDVAVASGGLSATLPNSYTYGTVNPLPPPAPPAPPVTGVRPLPVPRPSGGGGGSPNPLPSPRP